MLRLSAFCAVVLLAAAGPVSAQPAPSPPAASAPSNPPASTPSNPSASAPAANAAANPAGNHFTSEQAAKSHCPDDTVVWANLGSSKAYHLSGDRYYGKTRHGAFMCRKDADQAGFHAAGHRTHTSSAKSSASKTAQ